MDLPQKGNVGRLVRPIQHRRYVQNPAANKRPGQRGLPHRRCHGSLWGGHGDPDSAGPTDSCGLTGGLHRQHGEQHAQGRPQKLC